MKGLVTVIDSIAAVEPLLVAGEGNPDERLVILDMYSTLTMPPLPVRAYLYAESQQRKLQELFSSLSEEEKIKTLRFGFQVSNHQLVESAAPTVIRSIQASGHQVMVLTSSLTGAIDKHERLEVQLYKRLQSLGIDLEQTFPVQALTLNSLPAYESNYPTYYKGILATNSQSGVSMKGIVLVTFLQKIGYKPRQVIMVDDQRVHLYAVKEALTKLDPNIQFNGLLFEGAKGYMQEPIQEAEFIAFWKKQVANMLRN